MLDGSLTCLDVVRPIVSPALGSVEGDLTPLGAADIAFFDECPGDISMGYTQAPVRLQPEAVSVLGGLRHGLSVVSNILIARP